MLIYHCYYYQIKKIILKNNLILVNIKKISMSLNFST